MCLALAACSSSSKTDTTATTSAPTSTLASSVPTAPATAAPTAVATSLTISAHVLSVGLKAHTITVDPIAFLTGAAAVAAFKHDNPGAQEGPPNDYYIQNPTKDHVLLQFPAEAVVQLVHVKESSDQTHAVTVPQSRLVGYHFLTLAPFKITSAAGSVLKVAEIFVP
jgi:hypothetical protein